MPRPSTTNHTRAIALLTFLFMVFLLFQILRMLFSALLRGNISSWPAA